MNGCGHGTNRRDDFKDHVLCLIPKSEFDGRLQERCVFAIQIVDDVPSLTKNRYSIEECKEFISSFVIF